VTGRQVRILCNFTGTRACDNRLKKLIDNGYLERRRYIYGVAGLLNITNRAKKTFDIPLPIIEPRLDQIEHDIAVVDAAIYFIKKMGVSQAAIQSERELRHIQGFINRNHLSDFVFTKEEQTYCVEVELHQKARDRLEKNLRQNFMTYDVQLWLIPRGKVKIRRMVEDFSGKYPNVEVMDLEVVREFIAGMKK
jgi:hypothetical protein